MSLQNRIPKEARNFIDSLKKIEVPLFIVLAQVLLAEFIVISLVSIPFGAFLRNEGIPLGADFLNVYAAGVLTNNGIPAAVYDYILHRQAEEAVMGAGTAYFAWHYPPMFLAVASLFARAPYEWALGLYLAVGFSLYWIVTRCILPRTKESFWLLVAFPGVFINILNGQNGFLTASLLGAGMLFLESRPWRAGLMLGLTAYKPQYFVIVPFILFLGGHKKVALISLAVAAASAALSLAVFGADTWLAFFDSFEKTRLVVLDQGWSGWHKIQSVNAMVHLWGGSKEQGYALQAVAGLAAFVCATWIWRKKAAFDVRVAALGAALLLTTPYVNDYDLAILMVPIAFWVREASKAGFQTREKIIYGALWILPMFARSLGEQGAPLTPFVVTALMILSFLRAKRPIAHGRS